jgi:alginate O-acetyltransferase complex protein AlgI
MVFSSIPFIYYFLPTFLAAYFIFGRSNWIILLGSSIFYVWGEGLNIVLIVAMLVANFLAGLIIGRGHPKISNWALWAGISLNLAALAHYKYAQFLIANLMPLGLDVVKLYPIDPDHHLPLGISFFVFQMISYLVDVKSGVVPAERRISRLATYIMMFPHLIAGPIVRYAAIAGEIAERRVNLAAIGLGLQYFIIGLMQKVLIANNVARIADHAFSVDKHDLSFLVAWAGAGSYALQIYFDFCGYSNMAIGLALLMGFHFPRNFNYPYCAQSVTEFWRRWHMSLSTWFRDYVYIALGGNRAGTLSTLRNLLIVFFLTGLWHGAAWTFVLWGLFHGAFLLIERLWLSDYLRRWPKVISNIYTLVVVIFGWVLFRAADLDQATHFWGTMLGLKSPIPQSLNPVPLNLWLTPEVALAILLGVILAYPTLPRVLDWLKWRRIGRQPQVADPVLDIVYVHALPVPYLLAGLVVATAMLAGDSLNPFLYFRF